MQYGVTTSGILYAMLCTNFPEDTLKINGMEGKKKKKKSKITLGLEKIHYRERYKDLCLLHIPKDDRTSLLKCRNKLTE